jgi:hypothetical protein
LFGITEILQAKELSALLGGISGYILGRVTTDRSSASSGTILQRSQTVKAKSIGFTAPNMIKKADGRREVFLVNSRVRVKGSAGNSGDYSVTGVSATQLQVAEQTIMTEPTGPMVSIITL